MSERGDDAAAAWSPDPTWSASTMAPSDRVKEAMGMRIIELDRGRAVLTMTVRDDMANGFGITHGGMVFALADTAFAYACNEGAEAVVAQGADITFVRGTRVGDRLTATAERRSVRGRSGIYDVTVTDAVGSVVAEFRGRSRVLPGHSGSDSTTTGERA